MDWPIVAMTSKIVEQWKERVYYDLETAEAMERTGRYIYAIFMCQQAIEKCFKAWIAYRGEEILPIHNLRRLAELLSVVTELDEEKLKKLDFLSQYYINARYKENLADLSRGITSEVSKSIIQFSKETIQWLTLKMK